MSYLYRILLFLACLSLSALSQSNWPELRGPNAMGVSDGSELPTRWSAEENVDWKVRIPGMGWSSPVVWGNRIYLTTAISEGEIEQIKLGLYFGGNRPKPDDVHEWRVRCHDLESGKLLWEKTVHTGKPSHARHLKNSYASETPIVDGERVYAYIGNVGLFTFDLDGELLWERKWPAVKTRYGWGTAASPVLDGDRLYLINDNDEQSFLETIDAKTGKTIWRKDREEGSNWSPPFVWKNSQRTEIITTGSGKVRAYDEAGEVLWSLGGLSSITVTAPFADGDRLYFGSGYVGDKKRPLFAVRPGASGDISLKGKETSNEHIVWCQKQAASYMPTPVLYREHLYVLLDRGMLSCYDAETGKAIYGKQRLGKSGQFTASPLAWDGKLFCFGERGECVVVKAGERFDVLGRNELGVKELIMATPALAGDRLIIRTKENLFAIRGGSGTEEP